MALRNLQAILKKWNKEVFGDIQARKDKLLKEISAIQSLIDQSQTDELLASEEKLLKDLDVVLEQEEMMWYQKSREKWVVYGDRNSRFFHTSTIIKRRRNKVMMLRDGEGAWIKDPQELEDFALNYFKKLYSLEDVSLVGVSLPMEGFPLLTSEEKLILDKPILAMEVENAVRKMGSMKAPGPDGYQPVFYQENWEVVGGSVVRFVLDFFASGKLPENANDAFVVLIGKVAQPDLITQFRPISLCNVIFKTITKTMVSRLKRVMKNLIGPAQASFIPGRLSSDNIVIVQETIHSMRRKKGKRGWMLLKLDLEKAYDRVRWDFLEETLIATGLSQQWVRWVLECVSNPSMHLLWNG